jgi:tRNA pseudouridine38-40 synthase
MSEGLTRRIRATVSYDGTNYHGWQVQPGLPTIQGAIETALTEIEGSIVKIDGSGRTDAGVHALGQVAAFTLANPIPVENLRKALNRLLPRDIRILETAGPEQGVAPDFHPRFQAKAKTYEYRIWRADICPPFERLYVVHHPFPLDEAKMAGLAPLLEGDHDFTAFAASDERYDSGTSLGGATMVRTIFSSVCERRGDLLIYRVCGSGFLKHMVRNIVGVLLEVGKGNLGRADIEARLAPGCGIPSGPAAPARGLFLVGVEY